MKNLLLTICTCFILNACCNSKTTYNEDEDLTNITIKVFYKNGDNEVIHTTVRPGTSPHITSEGVLYVWKGQITDRNIATDVRRFEVVSPNYK